MISLRRQRGLRAAVPAVLADRDFRLLFIGQATSLLGDGMVGVALAFAVLDLTGSAADLGYVLAARSVTLVSVVLVGGVVADRLPRRRVMIAADLARLLGQATMATLLVTGHARIWELLVLQTVHGAASAVFTPASIGLLPAIVAGPALQEANALRGLAMSAGRLAGPGIAGAVVAMASPGWAIGADAATYAVSALMLARLRLPAHLPPPARSFVRDLREGWREVSSRTWVWTVMAASSLTNMLFAGFYVLGPAVSRDGLGGPAAWAMITSGLGAGALAGGVVALRIRPHRPLRAGVLAVGLCALPGLGLAAHLPAVAVAGLAALCGVGMTVFNTLYDTALQQHVPDKALSRVGAYDWFGSFACQPVGQAVAGPVAAALGTYVTLGLASAAQLTVALAALAVRPVRRLPAGGARRPRSLVPAPET